MNDDKLMQYVAGDAITVWNKAKKPLDNFLKLTSRKPVAESIKKNKFANNASYLEIGHIEAKLDQIYHGLWSVENLKIQQMINGVAVNLDLKVFHPVANVWLIRSGVAFKEFQLKQSTTEPSPANLSSKALERDVPIAAAEAFKNAAKKLGNAFGRHLNRDFKFDHTPDENIIEKIFGKEANPTPEGKEAQP